MGAGASVEGKAQWQNKIMGCGSKNEAWELVRQMQDQIRASNPQSEQDKAASKLQAMQRGRQARAPVKSGMDLKATFAMFANYGRSAKQKSAGDKIQSSKFRKMMQNAKFICKGMKCKNGKITGNKCDQEFVEYCKKGSYSNNTKELHFNDFISIGVPQLADLLTGGDKEEFCRRLCQNGKPKAAEGSTKFYDDQSTWTGASDNKQGSDRQSIISRLLKCLDTDGDGRLQLGEWAGFFMPDEALDSNGDNVLSPDELKKSCEALPMDELLDYCKQMENASKAPK